VSPLLRGALALVAGLPLLALPGSSAGLDFDWIGGSHGRAAGELLLEFPDERLAYAGDLADALASLGHGAVPVLFEIGATGRWQAPGAMEEPEERTLGLRQGREVLDALTLLPREAVHLHVATTVVPDGILSHRGYAARYFQRTGRATDLGLLLDAASPTGEQPVPRSLDLEFRGALGSILARDPEACLRIPGMFARARVELLPSIVLALGRAGVPDAHEHLGRLLSGDPQVDRLVLNQLTRNASELQRAPSPALADAVRRRLTTGDPALAREAALALGALGDFEGAGLLVDALDSEDAGLRANSAHALRELSGLRMGDAPAAWRLWHAGEVAWWREEAPALLDGLESGDRERVASALSEIARRRAFRHELAVRVAPLLDSPSALLRRRACHTLRELGSAEPLGALALALEDHDEAVRTSAHAALVAVTGRDLPPEPRLWLALD
jgi:hypothetical protein